MISSALRRELNKWREIGHFLLQGADATPKHQDGSFACYFCLKSLGTYSDFEEHGGATGPKLTERITIHHIDGVHENNAKGNKSLCHTKCHKSYHRTLANMARVPKDKEVA